MNQSDNKPVPLLAAKAVPNLITFSRLALFWPMILALQSKNYGVLFFWIALFFLLDNLDGHLARKLQAESNFGRLFDSFVDKTVFLVLVIFAFYFQIIPFYLFIAVLLINIIQLSFSFWIVFSYERKELPRTYLSLIGGGIFFLSLFLRGVFADLTYCLVIILYFNHLYYYGKQIWLIKADKSMFSRKIRKIKEAAAKIPALRKISQYVFLKLKRRNELNSHPVQIATAANLVTITRLLLIPPLIYYYWQQVTAGWIILLVIFVGADFLDGELARRFNQVSQIGKIMDAVVDKVLFSSFLLVWLFQGLLPVWLFGFIIMRVLLILLMAGVIWLTPLLECPEVLTRGDHSCRSYLPQGITSCNQVTGLTIKKPLPLSYFSFISIVSLLFFIYGQNNFWLVLAILFTWQLIVNYWHQGIVSLINKKVVV